MGALEFIVSGKKIGRAKYQPRNIVLAPLDSKNTVKKEVIKEEDLSTDTLDDDDASSEIKQCCKEWRAGLIQPRWVIYQERKGDFREHSILLSSFWEGQYLANETFMHLS